MPRIALYVRVSTSDQRLDSQLDQLRRYAAGREGYDLVEYADHAVSGRRDRRPGLDALLTACRRGEVQVVAVAALDRLARSLAHLARLGEELNALGVELVSLREAIDTRTAAGRAMFGMCAVFAALEADLTRERTMQGLAAARARGVKLGRRNVLDSGRRQRLARLVASGMSQRQIAALLECSKGTIHREARRLKELAAARA